MTENLDANVHSEIGPAERESLLGQKGCVVWLTGLSGSGKSTLAVGLERALFERGKLAFILDGDKVRQGLCKGLGFSDGDRDENIRRVSEVARLVADSGVICITAFISPFRAARERAGRIIGKDRFLEVHVAADLATCEKRDVKGLYTKARNGEISEFTGITSPYEPPENPALTIDTTSKTVVESVEELIELLRAERKIAV